MKVEQGHQFPQLPVHDTFRGNPALQRLLCRLLTPTGQVHALFRNLEQFAQRCVTDCAPLAAKLSSVEHEPRLIQYDAWGKRIDQLQTAEGWRELKVAAAREGIVAENYPALPGATHILGRDKLGQYARVYAFAKVFLYGPFNKLTLCPLSMTDGATRVLELSGTEEQRKRIYNLLTDHIPDAWTAGQWMTERPGGSDISRTETMAHPVSNSADGQYHAGDAFILDGFKWFSSATDGDMALALARTDPAFVKGGGGLSLFMLEIRDPTTRQLNGIRVHRLKRKLGTKYLPTAELELDKCKAQLVGEVGQGVRIISSVLNITRLYSASGGVFSLIHCLQYSTSLALTRQVGQRLLSDLPLHTQSLFRLTVLTRALSQLFFFNVALLGRSEAGVASAKDATLLRICTPALKAFTATRATEAMMGVMDSFGGQGYQEDSGLGAAEALRDICVERIWEGTAEVLCMDIVRVITKSRGEALKTLIEDFDERLQFISEAASDQPCRILGDPSQVQSTLNHLSGAVRSLGKGCTHLMGTFAGENASKNKDFRFAHALLDLIQIVNGSMLLFEQALWSSQALASSAALPRTLDLSTDAAQEETAVAIAWTRDVADLDRTLARFLDAVQGREAAGDAQDHADASDSLDVQHRVVYRQAKALQVDSLAAVTPPSVPPSSSLSQLTPSHSQPPSPAPHPSPLSSPASQFDAKSRL